MFVQAQALCRSDPLDGVSEAALPSHITVFQSAQFKKALIITAVAVAAVAAVALAICLPHLAFTVLAVSVLVKGLVSGGITLVAGVVNGVIARHLCQNFNFYERFSLKDLAQELHTAGVFDIPDFIERYVQLKGHLEEDQSLIIDVLRDRPQEGEVSKKLQSYLKVLASHLTYRQLQQINDPQLSIYKLETDKGKVHTIFENDTSVFDNNIAGGEPLVEVIKQLEGDNARGTSISDTKGDLRCVKEFKFNGKPLEDPFVMRGDGDAEGAVAAALTTFYSNFLLKHASEQEIRMVLQGCYMSAIRPIFLELQKIYPGIHGRHFMGEDGSSPTQVYNVIHNEGELKVEVDMQFSLSMMTEEGLHRLGLVKCSMEYDMRKHEASGSYELLSVEKEPVITES